MVMAPEQQDQQDVVYTIQEVARILKVSEQVVRQLVTSGELESKRVGRQYRVTRESLDKYLGRK